MAKRGIREWFTLGWTDTYWIISYFYIVRCPVVWCRQEWPIMKCSSPRWGMLLYPAWWHAGSIHLTQPWCETVCCNSPLHIHLFCVKIRRSRSQAVYLMDKFWYRSRHVIFQRIWKVLQLAVDCRNQSKQLVPLNYFFNMGNWNDWAKENKSGFVFDDG